MSNRTVRIGVIGCGMIGKSHLRKYAEMENVEVVALCDIDEPELERVAKLHDVKHTYVDWKDLLARDDIEAVDVCLHNALHRPASVDAMEAGKHVYCEKPIASTWADGAAMIEASKRTGQKLHIQVGTMFGPTGRAARRIVESGRLGEVYHARAHVNLRRRRPFVDGAHTLPFTRQDTAGGGALIDWGIYAISEVLWLMNNPRPVRVTGVTYDRISMHPGRRQESGYDVEELATGFVRFDNGATLDVLAAWAMHADMGPGNLVLGERAGLSLPPLGWGKGQPLKLLEHDQTLDLPLTSEIDLGWISRQNALDNVGDAYDSAQSHWVAVLQERVPLLPTAEVTLNMILIANGIYLSQKLGREIETEEITGAGIA